MNDAYSDLDSNGSMTRLRYARMPRSILLTLAMAPVLALLIGCSDSVPQASDDEIQVFELTIENRSVAVENDVIRVRQGQRVKLRWLADEPASIHLHGYDIRGSLVPGTPVVWEFSADATGRFPIEAHGFGQAGEAARNHDHSDHHDHAAHEPASPAEPTEKTLLYFEVHPR